MKKWTPPVVTDVPTWARTSRQSVTVVPASVLKRRKPSIGDVITMTPFQWDQVKDTGEYKRVQLHANPRDSWAYPAPQADVVDSGAAADIWL